MTNNDFTMDVTLKGKKAFILKVKRTLAFAILLTGVVSFSGIVFLVMGIINGIWNDIGMAIFIQKSIIYVSTVCIFIALIKMTVDTNPFSKTLTMCIKVIGLIFTASALLIPRLSGYVSSGFEIVSIGAFVLLDASLLTVGLLLLLLSALIKTAFEMQTEMDEVL